MAEYIKRKDALEILQSRLDDISQMSYLNMDWHELDIMRNAIENAIDDVGKVPAADVQPIRRGRWVTSHPVDIAKEFECTACGGLVELPVFAKKCYYDFCPNCYADMRDVLDADVEE